MLEFEDNNLIDYKFDDLEYYECRLSYWQIKLFMVRL
jgi:hypothetical protein